MFERNFQEQVRLAFEWNNLNQIKELLIDKYQLIEDDAVLYSALSLSCYFDEIDIVNEFIARHDDLNEYDPSGNTPLYVALVNEHFALARLLIKNGADINLKNQDGRDVLLYCIYFNQGNPIKFLRDNRADLNHRYHINEFLAGQTALMYAVMNRNAELAKLLVECGVDIHVADDEDNTVIFYAAMDGNKDLFRYFLNQGANLYHVNKNGDSPVIAMLRNNKSAILKTVLKAVTDVNIKNGFGANALFYAVLNHDYKAARLLIKKGIEVNTFDNAASDPLYYAIEEKDLKMVKLLIKSGARINFGYRFLGDCGEPETDVNNISPLILAVVVKAAEIAQYLIKNGADIHYKTKRNNTVLMHAAQFGEVEIEKLLIRLGVLLNETDVTGDTALICALSTKEVSAAKILIENGADTKIANRTGKSAMDYAREAGLEEIISMLKERESS